LSQKNALEDAGAQVDVVSPESGKKVKGWNHSKWGTKVTIDRPLSEASADDYDALLLPGGVMNPDRLRAIPEALEFVKRFFDEGKPIAAICHGPWTMIDAGIVRSLRITSWPSIRTDLINAGARWEDAEVVVDRGVVSSRQPDDIPAFNAKMIEEIAEGPHGSPGRREFAEAHA